MKYSSSLLQKFISIQDSPEGIAQNLILKTAEIEHIEKRAIAPTVVIWHITSCEKHPDADKLSVCQVDCGKAGSYQILCGGANVAKWLYVPVALPGTHLEKIGITIEPRKMRWLDSNGMICSKEELGINEDLDKHNIWALAERSEKMPEKSEKHIWGTSSDISDNLSDLSVYDFDDITDDDLGKPLSVKYPRLEWFIFDVDNKNLTNRPDLTWHFGVATELNAIYGWKMKDERSKTKDKFIGLNKLADYHKQFRDTNILEILEQSKKGKKKVVSQTDGLNTYILLELNGVEVQPSSFFTRLQMLDMGANPRSNRVDFSNLFMLVSGQPVHFFDAEKIDGNVIVRNAKDKEQFTDLFWASHSLVTSDIVIADEKKILALAGVVWGLDSGVTEQTKNILVEIANFDPVAVRKTWTRLGLRTDAELRYEKNINPLRSLYCLLLFLDELKYYSKDLGKFEIGGLAYFVSGKVGTLEGGKVIDVDFSKMEEFVFGKKEKGFEKIAKEILEWLWFIIKGSSIIPPIRRSPNDMNIPEDIYEEVARIYGYDKIDSLPMKYEVQDVAYTPLVNLTRTLEDILVRNLAVAQTETYPRIGAKTLNIFQKSLDSLYSLQNPVNPEMPYLRDEMTYGLLQHIIKNHKFFDECKIFDIGKIWHKGAKAWKGRKDLWTIPSALWTGRNFATDFVDEQYHLGVMLYHKDMSKREKDPILLAKNMIRTILKELGLTGTLKFESRKNSAYHPKKQAEIFYDKTPIWFIWSFHPLVLKAMKLPENAGVVNFFLSLDILAELRWEKKDLVAHYETLQDQIVWRDLCFVVNSDQDFWWVLAAVEKLPEISAVEVFDVYAGANLGEGKKSVSIKIKIIGDGNMTTEQINEVMNKAIKAGEKEGWKLRSAPWVL